MEAAIRSGHYFLTGEELDSKALNGLRGTDSRKETRVKIGDLDVGVAVANGLKEARAIMEELKAGRSDLHFVEVMTCPGGCVGGGGQMLSTDSTRIKQGKNHSIRLTAMRICGCLTTILRLKGFMMSSLKRL